jgi:LysM repeat protein
MALEKDEEMKDAMEEMREDLSHRRGEEEEDTLASSFDTGSGKKLAVLGAVAVGIVILLIVLLFRGGGDDSKEMLGGINARLDKLEQRTPRLESLEKKFELFEKEGKALRESVSKTDGSIRTLRRSLDQLGLQVEGLEERLASIRQEVQVAEKPESQRPTVNNGQYHEVGRGETLYRIARRYGLSVDELCRLNKITPNYVIRPGEKLLVSKNISDR